MRASLPEMAHQDLDHLARRMERLAITPPQTILLEGGTEERRLDLALFWAMAANCPTARNAATHGQAAAPCRICPTCVQIATNEYLDLFQYDGRISNKADEENPGPVRALSIGNIRALKSHIAAKPHGEGKRVVIFQGLLASSRGSAMNSLLKDLEDPCGHTLFVLLAPQRDQILKTLVSRSFCLTLPWRNSGDSDADLAPWEEALATFLRNGAGFLEKVGAKGALDATCAQRLILTCQRALCRCLGGNHGAQAESGLDKCLAPLSQNWPAAAMLGSWLSEAQEMLMAGVNPPRALEALSLKMYVLLRESRGKK